MNDYLKHYDKDYFVGGTKSGYGDYETCSGVIYSLYNLTLQAIEFRPETYLDIGCAYGFTVDIARRHKTKAWGVEPPTYAYEVAKTKPWGDFIIQDSLPYLESLEEMEQFETGVDLVTCYEVLEHIPKELIPESLARMMTLAKKYLVILPNMGETPHEHVEGEDITHISMLPKQWWLDLFKELGIEDMRVKGAEQRFDNHPFTKQMVWSGRLFVFKK